MTPARFAAAISVRMMPCLSAVETPEVGSSSRMTCGSSAKAEATSSSFFSPCDSGCAVRVEPVPEAEDLRDLAHARADRGIGRQSARTGASASSGRDTTAAAMVSATVSCGKIWMS